MNGVREGFPDAHCCALLHEIWRLLSGKGLKLGLVVHQGKPCKAAFMDSNFFSPRSACCEKFSHNKRLMMVKIRYFFYYFVRDAISIKPWM